MIITVEISCYPLTEDYLRVVDHFIRRMKTYENVKLKTSHSSTLVIGESTLVFAALQAEIEQTFSKDGKASFVMKVLGGDLTETVDISPYDE